MTFTKADRIDACLATVAVRALSPRVRNAIGEVLAPHGVDAVPYAFAPNPGVGMAWYVIGVPRDLADLLVLELSAAGVLAA